MERKAESVTRALVEAEFDVVFYLDQFGGLSGSTDPIEHFLQIGWIQGRDPSPQFSVFRYLRQNDDVLFRHLNPFVHYLTSGRDEGRSSYSHSMDQSDYLPWEPEIVDVLPMWFDGGYYLSMNPELEGSPNLLSQFLVLGWAEGRDPCARFSVHKYFWKYADVWTSGVNPLIHYLRTGQAEGREIVAAEGSRKKVQQRLSDLEWTARVKLEFDQAFYKKMYPSVRGLKDLFAHYCTTGWLEGRDPNAKFSVRQYLQRHRDVQDSGQEPFYHFIRYGIYEGRKTFPSDAVPEPEPSLNSLGPSDDEILRRDFDEKYYRSTYPELASIEDCFQHYMTLGWKEGRNPSSEFDTLFYLKNEGDIREAGINPYKHYVLHGKREGRRAVHRLPRLSDLTAPPKVSVIVPNYNHAKFLPERFKSILDQKYENLQLIILDDCSTDNSRDVIRAFAESYVGECQVVFNEVNSGNAFVQWQKGLSLANGDLIWICESDDTCDSEFLRQTIYLFQDQSVRLVFGNIQFMDAEGKITEGMTHLRESAKPKIWDEVNIMPAAAWFTGPLAVRNLIANVGGAVFRKPQLAPATWKNVREYKVAGDWYLYVMIAGGGQIAYAPEAKAYFRQHAANTSVIAFERESFYKELGRFHKFLRERWSVPREITFRFYNNMIETFERSKLAATTDLAKLVSIEKLIKVQKKVVHIAVAFLNFDVGGGEIFPIELLNALHRRGYVVSAVVQTMNANNDFVRSWLDKEIPVYVRELIAVDGRQLAADAGFDIIHSHNIWAEFYFLGNVPSKRFRYFVTLHGSYEVSHVQRNQIARFFDQVTWAYLADRNLAKFHDFEFDSSGFRLIPNGLARRLSANPIKRADLGISEDATVFLFAARSHPEKGWMQAAAAFDQLTRETDREIWLLMGGDGPEADSVQEKYGTNERIKLLGFRRDVDDLLEISDFMLLPTRFMGESMPLTLIQSILAGVPIISTDVGQIKDMLESDAGSVGVAIEAAKDDTVFINALHDVMRTAVAPGLKFSAGAFKLLAKRFSIETCVDRYIELYGLSKSPQPVRTDIVVNEIVKAG
jgi:glycosyltransferase involved in cell wall biosynthesis